MPSPTRYMAPAAAESPAAEPRLRLLTLGGAVLQRLELGREPQDVLGPGKMLALVTYLACAPGRSAGREQLIDLFFADSVAKTGRDALRQLLWQIRRRLGEDILSTGSDTVVLSSALSVDRDQFLAALERDDLEAAVGTYTGEFFPSFAAPGAGEFERWADRERDQLRDRFVHATGVLVRRWLSRARFREAQALARRAREAAPLRESVRRLQIEACVAAGDFIAAAAEADDLERILAEDDREPEPSTADVVRLARRLVPGNGDGPALAPLVAQLVGREREFAAVVTAWDELRGREGRHVHMVGGAGFGKTRLLRDLERRLRTLNARVVHVRANPGDRGISFALAATLAEALAARRGAAGISSAAAASLVALHPSLSNVYKVASDPAVGDEALRRRTAAIVELIGEVAQDRRLAILVDDLHWCDGPSRTLLQSVIQRSAELPVLFVTAARPGYDGPEAGHTRLLELRPLSRAEVADLVASLGALPGDAWVDRAIDDLHAATSGSPLLVLETLQLALERGSLERNEQAWHCPDVETLTTELREGGALRHRIAQLDPGERRVLLLLSLAGAPVPATWIGRAMEWDESLADTVLGTLEHRGLVARAGAHCAPAHDEIAALVCDSAESSVRRDANAALGRVVADAAQRDVTLLGRAALLLAEGGDDAGVAAVYRRFVGDARRNGDGRSPRLLARELLGERASTDLVVALTRSLPLHRRLGLDAPRRLASAAVIAGAVLVGGAALALRAEAEPDATLLIIERRGSDAPIVHRAPLFRGSWDPEQPIVASSVDRDHPRAVFEEGTTHIPHPDGLRALVNRLAPDSGGFDIWLVDISGRERRLTSAPGDDAGPRWSPDGRFVTFLTDRWGLGRSRSDIAILDTATLGVRQLTSGPERDADPAWSPDGTRIAFVRLFLDVPQPAEVCWTTPEGMPPHCTRADGLTWFRLGAWHDEQHVLASADSSGTAALVRINVATGRVQYVGSGNGLRVVSADGQWVACRCTRPGFRGLSWTVFPTDRPDRARLLQMPLDVSGTVRVEWAWTPRSRSFLDSMHIEPPSGGVPVDARYQLRARGVDQFGRAIGVYALRWWSGDTSVAHVDSAGVLQARRVGRVMVHASAGGWRMDSTVVEIRPPFHVVRLREDWRDALEVRWHGFGEPLPRLVTGPDGVPAFSNAGDSTHFSGAYTRARFDAMQGMGVEAIVSTPMSELQWQHLHVTLGPARDSADLRRWDHRSGFQDVVTAETFGGCAIQYPYDEGVTGQNRILFGNGPLRRGFSVPANYGTGAWFKVRLQVFPDGRCGFAVDGRPMWISENDLPVNGDFVLVLRGKTYRTRMLVGPLEVWEGVRSDLDWTAVDSSVARAAPPARE